MEDCFHLGVKALICCKGKLLLLEKHSSKKQYWDLPGGRLKKGESVLETLIREVEEETGLKEMGGIRPLTTVVTDIRIKTAERDVGLIFSIFRCDLPAPFHPQLSEEHVNFGWFTPCESVQKLKSQYPSALLDLINTF